MQHCTVSIHLLLPIRFLCCLDRLSINVFYWNMIISILLYLSRNSIHCYLFHLFLVQWQRGISWYISWYINRFSPLPLFPHSSSSLSHCCLLPFIAFCCSQKLQNSIYTCIKLQTYKKTFKKENPSHGQHNNETKQHQQKDFHPFFYFGSHTLRKIKKLEFGYNKKFHSFFLFF